MLATPIREAPPYDSSVCDSHRLQCSIRPLHVAMGHRQSWTAVHPNEGLYAREHTWACTSTYTHSCIQPRGANACACKWQPLSRPEQKEKHFDRTAIPEKICTSTWTEVLSLKWNNGQICHPTEHCVCSLNVRVKIPHSTLKKIGL